MSLFAYTHNNPVNMVDPDGEDTLLAIWATTPDEIGHAGVATSTGQMNKDGQDLYRYTDLWPSSAAGGKNFYKNLGATYNDKLVTLDQVMNTDVTGSEGRPPEGVINISATMSQDKMAITTAEKSQKINKYNGLRRNCSDHAKNVLNSFLGAKVKGEESFKKLNYTTPNGLYKEVSSIKGATVYKDPKNLINNKFAPSIAGETTLNLLGNSLQQEIFNYEANQP